MDQAAIEAAKLLGTGSAQLILATGVVLFGGVALWLGRTLYIEVKACHAHAMAMLERKIESDNRLADAIESSTRVTEAALAALRRSA
jgi:intracellular septation protein A